MKHPPFQILPTGFLSAAALMAVLAAMPLQQGIAQETRLSEVSHIHGIAVDPSNPSRVYLATHHGLFLTAPDGMAERISDNGNDYMGFTPHPTDAKLLYASGHPSGGGNLGIIISRDAGKTWEPLSPGAQGPVDFHAMTISRADPNVIYGFASHGGGIQVSRDGGKTWEHVGQGPDQVIDLTVSAVDPDWVFAGTMKGVMLSRDGGKSWEASAEQGRPISMIETAPNGNIYALAVGRGLLSTPGSAINWALLSSDLKDKVVLHIAIDPTNPQRMFAVSQESEILTSTDGGRTWSYL
jgi:photosystem II stability/assembly factor-like uncharacterized protein